MKLNPYLSFDGDCEAAFKFYEQVLGGTIEDKMTWGESPTPTETSPEWKDKVMHMQISLGDQVLMGSDAPPNYFESAKGMSVLITVENAAKAEDVFAALAEGGTVQMPIQETFWADRFGMVEDKFGTPWMINCDKTT